MHVSSGVYPDMGRGEVVGGLSRGWGVACEIGW